MSLRAGATAVTLSAGLSTAIAFGMVTAAAAGSMPGVQLTPSNQPRQCTTPGRLMAFLRDRNPRLQSKFDKIAVDYMRHGRDLGIRWDYAFFQMVVETNSLKFTGDVRPSQNNFAGLGATGGGVRGEHFSSVSDGVRAHQQHLMIYAGIRVDDPVADRTRKVQSWGILDKWRRRLRHPVTFADVGKQWAPVDRGYARDIQAIADAFYSSQCARPDPDPGLLTEATGRTRQASFDRDTRAGLGASNVPVMPRYKTLNRPRDEQQNRPATSAPPRNDRTAAVSKFAAPAIKPPATGKCRVWTASYGGQQATIIRSEADGTINYTVLDVNKGREDAEAKAYIAAYAQGGRRIENFATKSAAMDRAFKLCPEG
ncbi:MAG: glucosaminidase domain-containing protein [Planctomycetales bacterium]|nr:glucosaminidase domain-containing protein [Planctomycetales bacterium]